MSGHEQPDPGWMTRARIWHFMKYGSVGFSGFVLNASLFAALSQFVAPRIASPMVFVVCGQLSFLAHAFLTWRDARERKLRAAWALFTPANWTAGAVNYAVFGFVQDVAAWNWVAYAAAMVVSVPLTYAWNAICVFPKETMPKERILRLWEKLVEWNKTV